MSNSVELSDKQKLAKIRELWSKACFSVNPKTPAVIGQALFDMGDILDAPTAEKKGEVVTVHVGDYSGYYTTLNQPTRTGAVDLTAHNIVLDDGESIKAWMELTPINENQNDKEKEQADEQ